MKRWTGVLLGAALATVGASQAFAQKEVTIAHQDMVVPYRVGQAARELEQATGWKIGEAGSSPISAAVSQGIDVEVFWILEDIADSEALVVRKGAGIAAPQDLKGKRIGVPFVSTTHFHLLFALEQFGMKGTDARIVNMRPPEIAAAWERGDLDATFIWNPVLAQVKQKGDVLISSGLLSRWGKATFDGMIVDRKFARENADFVVGMIKLMAKHDEAYRSNPGAWLANKANVDAVAKISGAKPEDVPAAVGLYRFPTMAEQVSDAWLGGGANGGAARALKFTSEFLKEQGRIQAVLPNYGERVNPEWVKRAMAK